MILLVVFIAAIIAAIMPIVGLVDAIILVVLFITDDSIEFDFQIVRLLLPVCGLMWRSIATIWQKTRHLSAIFPWFLFDSDWNWNDVSLRSHLVSNIEDPTNRLITFHVQLFKQNYSFNVIIAYATNYLLQKGVENATTTARYGVADTQAFLHLTSRHSHHILVTNYDELTEHLESKLNGEQMNWLLLLRESLVFNLILYRFVFAETADKVSNKLKEESKAVYLTQLAVFVKLLPEIKGDLFRMKEITNGLRSNASQLSDGKWNSLLTIRLNRLFSFIYLFFRFTIGQKWIAEFVESLLERYLQTSSERIWNRKTEFEWHRIRPGKMTMIFHIKNRTSQ